MILSLQTISNTIAFSYMENYIKLLEEERLAPVKNYLQQSGLNNTTLTQEEKSALEKFRNGEIEWREFRIFGNNNSDGIFNLNNTHSILQEWIVPNSGKIPYVTAGETNNSIWSYIDCQSDWLETGNSIMIGGKTLVITYQEQDFVSNDSHNLALYIKDENCQNELCQLFIVSALYKSLKPKYSWGNSISKKKIMNDSISLPVTSSGIDFAFMEHFIKAIEKNAVRGIGDMLNQDIKNGKSKLYDNSTPDYYIAAEPEVKLKKSI